MPYVSAKQRRFMKWKHPEIDAKWKAEGHDYVKKGLPRALADIPKHGEITNPYIKGRVFAHDRGRAAGKLTAMAGKSEQKVNAHRKPLRSRHPLTAPFTIVRDESERFYGMQGVRDTRARAARVVSQGRAGREFSRDQIGKSMRLSEVQKSVLPPPRPKDDRKRKGAATGVGAVGVGAGLAGGGIPGLKATRNTGDVLSAPLHKMPGELWRARRAGVGGYRQNAHHTLVEFDLKNPNKVKGTGPGADYSRSLNAGKQVPEKKIISHMKRLKVGSNVVLGAGVGSLAYGLHRKKQPVAKRDDRRNTALVASGGTVAAGSIGGARLLEHHGRKWAKQAKTDYDVAQRMVPGVGGATVKRNRKHPNVPTVRPEIRDKRIAADPTVHLAGRHPEQIAAAAHRRGRAAQGSYFSHVYGTMGKWTRKVGKPAGLGVAAVGGTGLAANKYRASKVEKAYKPTYFGASAPTERISGEGQRGRTEVQHQGAKAAQIGLGGASTAALGARWAGHKHAPIAIGGGAAAAAHHGVPPEMVRDATKKAMRLHRWAAPKRGRLLAASALASGGAVGAGTVARWKKDEITGISQDLGRASAGDRGKAHSNRVTKSALTAIGIEYGTKGAKKYADLTPAARKKLGLGVAGGASTAIGVGATSWSAARARRMARENKELKAAGGFSGPVMKGEVVGFGKSYASEPLPFGKAHGGSNVRQYEYLPENIRQDVGYGSIGVRRNPMSALDLFASSRIMAASRGNRISNRRLNAHARREMNFAGSRAMLYSPTGRGSMF